MRESKPLTPAGRRVLDVASTLFYERGINTVGMDLIAATARVTKKTVYDRFGSKEALVTAYLTERDHTWRQWLSDSIAPAHDPRERILATFDRLAAWMSHNYRGCAMINAYAELSDPGHPGRAVVAAQKTWMRDLYAGLLEQAGIGDDHLATQLLMLHEGAVVAANIGDIDMAVAAARTAAATLLRAHGEYA